MSIHAGDLAALFDIDIEDAPDDDDRPLGTRLRGRFAEIDIDSVEAVREVREP